MRIVGFIASNIGFGGNDDAGEGVTASSMTPLMALKGGPWNSVTGGVDGGWVRGGELGRGGNRCEELRGGDGMEDAR